LALGLPEQKIGLRQRLPRPAFSEGIHRGLKLLKRFRKPFRLEGVEPEHHMGTAGETAGSMAHPCAHLKRFLSQLDGLFALPEMPFGL
jgi:hypothetical protein